MGNEAWMLFHPGLDIRMFVRPVVVHHQVQRRLARKLLIEPPQESKEFLMPMPLKTLPVLGELLKSRGDRPLIQAATVLLPPI